MKNFWKNKHDSNYYWGLTFMLTIPLALVLEFWKYSFCKPAHFPLYLLIYGWGYLLLLKSDLRAKIHELEAELKKLTTPKPGLITGVSEPEFTENPLPFGF